VEIRLDGLTKHYLTEGRQTTVLDGIDLTIPANRIFTLLGPSGCGKTTLLRCIVGLETPDAGEIRIGDEVVWSAERGINVPVERRGLGMVFQTYAIWPHMTVFDNVAYPLQVRRVARDEIRRRVAETLAFVQLKGFEGRLATRLSGGQQQRVALARALVAKPRVILFDEPLSNLDAKLREETRKELRTFLSELGITAVYVTHDRVEALALSDRIAVMRAGQIVEIGEPRKIYFAAEHRFVADFIGRASLLQAHITGQERGGTRVESGLGSLLCRHRDGVPNTQTTLCIRPEDIRVLQEGETAPAGWNAVEGKVASLVFVGEACEGEIAVGETHLLARFEADTPLREGSTVRFAVAPDDCLLVEA